MEPKNRYTAAEMRDTLRCLAPVFDVVRLVDPRETAVLTLDEDGTLRRAPYSCFRVWEKGSRCENCTSANACLEGCQHTKYEFIQNNVFYVVSRPLVLETAEGDQQVVLEIVSHVSDQLLLEQADGKSLAERIAETHEKLYRDELTQAFNRRYLNEMNFLHRRTDRVSAQVGVILLDLRQFKLVNDTCGHLVGDRVLSHVAAALTGRVRERDSVVRIGGDEFVVVLTGCGEDVVRRKLEDLRQAVRQVPFGDDPERTMEADMGYAYTEHFQSDRQFLLEMLETADRRMYAEKRRRDGAAT